MVERPGERLFARSFPRRRFRGKEVKKADDGPMIRPGYYNPDSAYEPRKVIKAWGLDWNLGTALKYIERRGNKQGETTPCV